MMFMMTLLSSLVPLIVRFVLTIANDPNMRKLDTLGSLNRQLRLDESQSIRDTHLTDFFQKLYF
ncbi:hypothetical protein K443DRAFT_653029 [Laccaria amethystina LaAM-08-1]|uniref:Uncharacterized protein n=1 Tax=Laccaria amethystina LaAM-08-1 TaxID=1095629 RepID=A0A0C9Y0U7_9AGAR|nr:hypothetical protein K443DRAFT_653029 [Laccaria amethystina LaAM-08-1]